jgi:L-threonylcarbamoyladenylate synthase
VNAVTPEKAAAALRAGKVALVPTETVVGLVAAEPGLPRIREIKGRDAEKPIALLCGSAQEAFGLAGNVPPLARTLSDLYWPGPLTLVLDLPNGETIGVRVPAGRAVGELLAAYGGPLYATSANPSGEPARAAADEVDVRVLHAVDVVVEGDPGSGEASAVVDLSGGNVRLLRADSELSQEQLASLANRQGSLPEGG